MAENVTVDLNATKRAYIVRTHLVEWLTSLQTRQFVFYGMIKLWLKLEKWESFLPIGTLVVRWARVVYVESKAEKSWWSHLEIHIQRYGSWKCRENEGNSNGKLHEKYVSFWDNNCLPVGTFGILREVRVRSCIDRYLCRLLRARIGIYLVFHVPPCTCVRLFSASVG